MYLSKKEITELAFSLKKIVTHFCESGDAVLAATERTDLLSFERKRERETKIEQRNHLIPHWKVFKWYVTKLEL